MTVALTDTPKFKAFDTNGDPLVGGKLYSYTSGTTTPKTTWKDANQTTENTNPVILDSYGQAEVWLEGLYTLKLTDANDVTLWSVDGISSGEVTTGASLPSIIAGDGGKYARVKSDESGIEYASVFASTTAMVFYQAAAPVGWTAKTDWTATAGGDCSLIVGDTYSAYGGSSDPASVTISTHSDHTHNIATHRHGAGSHTHSVTLPETGWPYSLENAVSDVISTSTGADSSRMTGRTLTSAASSGYTDYSGTLTTGNVSASGAKTHTAYSMRHAVAIVALKD